MYEIILFLFSVLASLFVALSAVKFDRWLADKKELKSILLSLGFEMAENISIARTIAKKAKDDIKTVQNRKHPFAPFPTFSDLAYHSAKNSEVFFHFVNKERTDMARDLVKNLHECYNSIRLVNSMMKSEQQVKLEIMMGRCPKEYGEQLLATTHRTAQEVIEPLLIKTLLLLGQVEPKLHKTISLLSEIPKNQNVRSHMESGDKEKPEKPAGHKKGKASALVWLAFFPLLIVMLIVAWMLPCFLISSFPQTQIQSYGSPPHVESTLELRLVTPDALYKQFDIGDKLFMGKPSVDALAFQVVIQRDRSSLILYSAYVIFVALIIYYSATLSRIASVELPSKLQMFVGLSIAVVAFLWSVRPVVGTITIVEVGLMFGLFVWLLIEIRDWYRKS